MEKMSRIHDALKLAEQERATAKGTHVDPISNQPSGATVMPTLSSELDYESLLTRCPQSAWNPDPRTMLFFQEDDSRTGAEEFRTLRSRLYQIREKKPLLRLLVTSALPKEGKSFVAANLAQVMVRQHGRRALLIDADLRDPVMHRHFGVSQSPGLAEYLLGECDEFSAMQRGSMENLFFLPAGRAVSNAPELLANGRLQHFLQCVEPLFDWIILDSSPVIPVSDATLIADFCDGILMVMRSNETPSDLTRRAREAFPGKLMLGVVLNGAPS
jgi:capsular exopolysaccharide synthesis family protein